MNTPASGDENVGARVPRPGKFWKVWDDAVWSKVIAAGIIRVATTVVILVIGSFWAGVWVGGWNPLLSKQPRRITLVEEVAAPESGPGRQGVTVAVQPPPSSGEKVQVWIKQGDYKWYRCTSARQLADNAFWQATCTFGNPESKSTNDKAKPGQNWFSYGVFCSKDISADVPDALPDINTSWQAHVLKESKSEPAVMPATYRGR
jgi:hypothetical protein